MFVTLLIVALVLLAGVLAAYAWLQDREIALLKEQVRVQETIEHRLTRNIRTLQEELIHHAAASQIVVLWRNRHLTIEREGNQADLDRALASATDEDLIVLVGNGSFTFTGSSAPRVVAWGSSAPRGSVGKYAVLVLGIHDNAKPNIPGATILETPKIETPADWCDYYGAKVEDGVAILYKGVDDDWATDQSRQHGIFYTPGTTPEAADWDGGKVECGNGLHFSPHPVLTLYFNPDAKHYNGDPIEP